MYFEGSTVRIGRCVIMRESKRKEKKNDSWLLDLSNCLSTDLKKKKCMEKIRFRRLD